jgi:hypothetical protein
MVAALVLIHSEYMTIVEIQTANESDPDRITIPQLT